MALEFDQVVEGVGAAQLAGVDQRHEQVADLRSVERAIEQRVLSMQHRSFQAPLDDVVIQRGSGFAKEQRQGMAVPQQICDRLTEPRVGLGSALGELRLQLGVQSIHHRPATILMKS